MNTKLKATSILSIAAILAISVLALASLQEVEAKQPKQIGRPDFIANLNWIQTVPLEKGNTAGATAKFWFNEDKSELMYEFHYNKLNLASTPPAGAGPGVSYPGATDTITKIHVHENVPGIKGPHTLNIMGPWDEPDVVFNTAMNTRTITGIWNNNDQNFGHANPAHWSWNLLDKRTPTSDTFRDILCDGGMYLNVHSVIHGPGALRGQILPVSNAC